MKTKLFFRLDQRLKKIFIAALLFLNIGLVNQAHASHEMGGDFEYDLLDSVNRIYRIRLVLYRDCSGIAMQNQVSVNITFSNGCPTQTYSIPAKQQPPLGNIAVEVTPLCNPKPLTTCSSSSSPVQGIQKYVYEQVVQFPSGCGIANLSYANCCRNANAGSGSITNLAPTSNTAIWIEAKINTDAKRGNNSVKFKNTPFSYICAGNLFRYNHHAIDDDGDSLVYSMYAPYVGPNQAGVTYSPPLSAQKPFQMVESGIVLDQKTGQFQFTPTTLQTSIMGFLIKEYRKIKGSNGQDSVIFVGSTVRDVQISVSGTCTPINSKGILKESVKNGNFIDSLNLDVCATGKPLEFKWRINAIGLPLDVKLNAEMLGLDPGWKDSTTTFTYVSKKDSLLSRDTLWGTFTYKTPTKKVGCYPLIFNYGYCMNGFNTTGSFTANVCFKDSTYCDSTIIGGGPCSGKPSLSPLQGPDSICPGTSITFQINAGNKTGLTYLWQASIDTINWTNLTSTGPVKVISAQTTGCVYYRVKVSCTNSGQFTYSNLKRVCMKNCATPALKPCDTLHNVSYTKNCNQVTFEARNAPAGYSMTYSWYFSNNTTGQGRIITKPFMNGWYYAKLYYCLYNANQQLVCCDSTLVNFFVNCATSNPCAIVKANFGYSITGSNVIFKDSSTYPTGMALTYQWLFGDGNSASLKNPTHTYASAGTYTVRLVVTGWFSNSAVACRDTVYKVLTVGTGNPCANLIPNFTFVQTGNSFNFTNTSTYNGLGKVGVLWVFGDGTSSTLNNPTKAYTTPGAKYVTLNVTAFDTPTGTTCVKAISIWVQPSSSPCAGFDARFTFTKNFLNLNFTNTSVGAGTNTTYLWNFGNGATSTQANPSYTYPLPGMYKVVFKVTTTLSTGTCIDTAVYYINVTSSNPCKDSGYVSLNNYPCGTYISPICGCDGVTYKNYCELYKAGVKQYTQGPCANDTTYVKICGYVYNDLNYNCSKDSMDYGVNGIQIKLAGMGGNYTTYTNHVGYYQFYAPKGSYVITQNLSQSSYYYNNLNLRQMCPANNAAINVNAPIAGNIYCNNDFYDTVKSCLDLAIMLSKFRNITPGFNRTVYINYKNRSPFAVANVKVKYKKNAVQTFVSATPPASSSSGNIYTWNIGTLAPNQAGLISVKLFTPLSVALGTMAYDTAWIEPDTNDCELANNRATLKDSCRGSWDPNDKAVSPQGEGEKGNITKDVRTLDYLVRFQNTGTAPAFNVRIEDMLDTDFDWSTLKVHAVSHPYQVFMQDNGKLIFEFKDIMLPDSATDYEASQGFVNYSIDMKDNLAIGTEIQNTAAIYFDFNEPVITNTTLNTLVEKTTGVIALEKGQLEVKMFPNPMRDVANFIVKAEASDKLTINISDISGKVVRQLELDVTEGNHVTSFNVNDLTNGIYIIHLKSANHASQSIKVIKE